MSTQPVPAGLPANTRVVLSGAATFLRDANVGDIVDTNIAGLVSKARIVLSKPASS